VTRPAERPTDLVSLQARHLGFVVVASVALGVVALVLLGNTSRGLSLSPAYPVALIGSAGGTANAYRRLQRLQATAPARRDEVPAALAVLQVYLSPVTGGVFALVLYVLFLAGLLQGDLFPTFACAAEPFTDFGRFADCGPSTNSDVAMALVWAFVAGFGEHFVPNVLDRFIAPDPKPSPPA
jgi:hypothetical protein